MRTAAGVVRKNSFWKQIDLTKIVIALISAASLVLMGEKATGTEHTYDCPTIINEAISQQQAHPQLKLIYGGEENEKCQVNLFLDNIATP